MIRVTFTLFVIFILFICFLFYNKNPRVIVNLIYFIYVYTTIISFYIFYFIEIRGLDVFLIEKSYFILLKSSIFLIKKDLEENPHCWLEIFIIFNYFLYLNFILFEKNKSINKLVDNVNYDKKKPHFSIFSSVLRFLIVTWYMPKVIFFIYYKFIKIYKLFLVHKISYFLFLMLNLFLLFFLYKYIKTSKNSYLHKILLPIIYIYLIYYI